MHSVELEKRNKMELIGLQTKWDGTFRQPTVAQTM